MNILAFTDWMAHVQQRTETALAGVLPDAVIAPRRLHEAMRYAVLGGGKRVRSLLVHAAGQFSDAPIETLGVVEVYAQTNCKAFSIKENKEVECTAKSLPAMPPTGTAEGRQ